MAEVGTRQTRGAYFVKEPLEETLASAEMVA
jgi:hypothetical protein